MRGAPSVSVPVGRSRLGLYLMAWLSGLGVLTWLSWVLASPSPGRQALVAFVMAVCGAWAWHSQRRTPAGVLHWSGKAWFLLGPAAQMLAPAQAGGELPGREVPGDGLEVEVAATLDLQSVLLLRVSANENHLVGWWWLTRGEDAAHWQAVRRAVHGPRPAAAGDAGLVPLP